MIGHNQRIITHSLSSFIFDYFCFFAFSLFIVLFLMSHMTKFGGFIVSDIVSEPNSRYTFLRFSQPTTALTYQLIHDLCNKYQARTRRQMRAVCVSECNSNRSFLFYYHRHGAFEHWFVFFSQFTRATFVHCLCFWSQARAPPQALNSVTCKNEQYFITHWIENKQSWQ